MVLVNVCDGQCRVAEEREIEKERAQGESLISKPVQHS